MSRPLHLLLNSESRPRRNRSSLSFEKRRILLSGIRYLAAYKLFRRDCLRLFSANPAPSRYPESSATGKMFRSAEISSRRVRGVFGVLIVANLIEPLLSLSSAGRTRCKLPASLWPILRPAILRDEFSAEVD